MVMGDYVGGGFFNVFNYILGFICIIYVIGVLEGWIWVDREEIKFKDKNKDVKRFELLDLKGFG